MPRSARAASPTPRAPVFESAKLAYFAIPSDFTAFNSEMGNCSFREKRDAKLRDALNAKGNFRFQIVKWRDRPLVDLRRKR